MSSLSEIERRGPNDRHDSLADASKSSIVANAIPFRLITPVSIAFEGDAELVIAVGTEGEEGILPSHAPFLTALRPGILRANAAGGQRLEFATSDGFLQALPDRIIVLVDSAQKKGDVDRSAAKSDLDAANERQKALTPQTAEYAREQSIIDFANARLQLAG